MALYYHHASATLFVWLLSLSACLIWNNVGFANASPRIVEYAVGDSSSRSSGTSQQQIHPHPHHADLVRAGSGSASLSSSSSSSPPSPHRNNNVPEALRQFTFNARGGDNNRIISHHEGDEHITISSNNDNEGGKLADIALVVTVDGAIHAIKRDTGTWVWSLHDENTSEQRQEVLHNPLVKSSMRRSRSSSSSNTTTAASSSNFKTNSSSSKAGTGAAPSPSLETDAIPEDQDGNNEENEEDEDDDDEIYIIEPHAAGDIYVYHKSTGQLQRLPLSVTQLVELSPFTFPVHGQLGSSGISSTDNKLFLGKKESKLVGVDLKSGRLVGVFGPEAGWCEWPQEPKGRKTSSSSSTTTKGPGRLDGTELGIEDRPQDLLYIGRTDYHISIYSKTQGLLQTLSYTSYGPSSLGNHNHNHGGKKTFAGPSDTSEENEWHSSLDGRYIQPMHDGSVVCLNPDEKDRGLQWTNRFSHPVVEIFDIIYPDGGSENIDGQQQQQQQQQQPTLSPHPHRKISEQLDELANLPPSTFIGKLEHVNSNYFGSSPSSSQHSQQQFEYYAMSNTHFPLVSFAPSHHGYSIVGGGGDDDSDQGGRTGGGSQSQKSIVGSHRVEEPIDSGKTIEPPPEHLSIDPAPPALNGTDGMKIPYPGRIPGNPGDDTIGGQGSPSALMQFLTIGGYEPSIALIEGIFILLGILVLATRYIGKKFTAGSKNKNARQGYVRVETPTMEAGPSSTSSSSSNSNSFSYSSRESISEKVPIASTSGSGHNRKEGDGDGNGNGNAATTRRLPSHASSPSLDKALPALPLEETPAIRVPPNIIPERRQDEDNNQSDDDNSGEGDDVNGNENENDKVRHPKKGRRRRRGGGGGKRNNLSANNDGLQKSSNEGDGAETSNAKASTESALKAELPKMAAEKVALAVRDEVMATSTLETKEDGESGRVGSLLVSSSVIGYGSHGTVVLKGTFQGRAVAVKRLLKDFVTIASHEVSLLQESDDHPNVIRYFCKESRENFHYIALELCPTSLFELIDTPSAFPTLIANFDPIKALKQITKGLTHLHKLKIIHRDLKPQNILVATSAGKRIGDPPVIRLVISDFGLCKKLDLDESSFLQSTRGGGNHAPGSFGYRAPEVLRGEVDANDLVNESPSISHSTDNNETRLSSRSASSSSTATLALGDAGQIKAGRKLTRAIDIFSLGCIFYFVLTMGEHPFGTRYEREINILNDKIFLNGLTVMTENVHEAQILVKRMCASDPRNRPSASDILLDPLFWSASQSLHFLCDSSDRFEIMEREDLILSALEAKAPDVVGQDWLRGGLDRNLIDNLGKYRKYDGGSVRDLLRVMRNKKHHYQDLPENVRRSLGEPPVGFLSYFTKRFPKLLLHVHVTVKDYLSSERMFSAYFEHEDI